MKAWAGVAVLLAGCGAAQDGAKKPVATLTDDMAAAVFRYQFGHNASARQSHAAIYCIGYGSNPGSETVYGPSQKLLNLLADVRPRVASYTACAIDPAKGVVDKSTGGSGLLFKIATVSCSTMKTCIIHGGFYEGYLSATSNTYFVRKRESGWSVIGDKDDWIS